VNDDTLESLDGTSRAMYVDRSPGVRKYVQWRDRTGIVQTVDAQTAYRVDSDTAEESDADEHIEAAFADLSDAGVRTATAGDIDAATEERLKHLGYM
jgi:hypothetical protein